jgi:hypothetical protein
MSDFLFGVLIFACGSFCGFITAAFFAVGARDEPQEFDGGYSVDHPPVRTTIWHSSIREKE